MSDTTRLWSELNEDVIHNWHVPAVKSRWEKVLSAVQQADVEMAHRRHHQNGESALELAARLVLAWDLVAQEVSDRRL